MLGIVLRRSSGCDDGLAIASTLPITTTTSSITSTSTGASHLGLHSNDLSSTKTTTTRIDLLEHWCVLEHIGKNHPTHFAASDEGVLQCRSLAITSGVRDVGQLAVHVVLSLDQLSTIHLASLELDRDNVLFSLMKKLDRNADTHDG
jgi:hypothetical protein